MAELDEDTLFRAVARDVAAGRTLIRFVYKRVAGVLTPACPDVEDVTHEALLQIIRSISTYTPATSPRSWCSTIAVNCALSHLRTRKRKREEALAEEGERSMPPVELPEIVDRALLARVMLSALAEHQRALLIHRYWDGMSDEAIAEALAIPLGTVRTRIRAAHQALARRYREESSVAADERVDA